MAISEIFFVDPYLDAELVSRYLPHVKGAVRVRLLAGEKRLSTLIPAVGLFARESSREVLVRSSRDLHDRYLFVDGRMCYLSGASFKDGAKKSPAVLTQISDGFQAMWSTYDRLWTDAKVLCPAL